MADDNDDVLARLDALMKRHSVNPDAIADIPTLTDEVDPATINEGGIPTLTEVVEPDARVAEPPLAIDQPAPGLDVDALTEEVATLVRTQLQAQISANLKNELQARLKAAYNQMMVAALGEVRRELEKTVEQQVRETLARHLAELNAPKS